MPPPRSRRVLLVTSIVAGVIAVAIVAVVGLPRVASNLGLGRTLEQAEGQIVTHDYAAAKGVPANETPGWLPQDVTNVTVEVPGKNSKIGHPVEVDATLADASQTAPSSCTPAHSSFPWDAAAWPGVDIRSAAVVACDGWTETVQSGHLYAWRYKS